MHHMFPGWGLYCTQILHKYHNGSLGSGYYLYDISNVSVDDLYVDDLSAVAVSATATETDI